MVTMGLILMECIRSQSRGPTTNANRVVHQLIFIVAHITYIP
jgi:hypothetical protein